MLIPKSFTIFCLGVLGLVIGSFLNVVIYRLPRMIAASLQKEFKDMLKLDKTDTSLSLAYPRSHCISCQQIIPFWHNIPLLSYCLLRGRCHKCKTKISIRYPIVEALSLVLSIIAGLKWGVSITLLFALLFIFIVIALSFIDLFHQLLPDNLTLSLLWIGLIANTQTLFTSLPNAVFGAVFGYIGLWLFAKIFQLLTGKEGMGHGDFKLFSAFGAFFGSVALPYIIFVASLSGAIVGIIYLKITKQGKNTPIPFGPFLCISGLLYLLGFIPMLK